MLHHYNSVFYMSDLHHSSLLTAYFGSFLDQCLSEGVSAGGGVSYERLQICWQSDTSISW